MKTTDLLIGFDLGTSATKAILTDTTGTIIAKASRAVEYSRPFPDYCEFDSRQYVENVFGILQDLASQTTHPEAIRAISFCGASGNALLLDDRFEPITNTIAWNDRRTAGMGAELWPGLDEERVYKQAGWPFNGVMPLAQLAWFKKNDPAAWSKAGYFTMNNDYLYHRLCGRLVVDPSKATTFYLQDQLAETWNEELLAFLDIESTSLSEIVPSGTVVGTLLPELCVQTGLSKETLIVAGSFDHPSAARSTGVFQEGDILISAGTSWVVFAPVKNRQLGIDNTMLVDPFLTPEGCWGVMLALTSVAEKIDALLKNRFGDINELYKVFDTTAARSGPGAEGLYIDPWKQDPDEVAQAAAAVGDSSFSRALMEGCAYQLKAKIDQLQTALTDGIGRIVMVGGPTKSPVWPGILAGVIGAPLHIPESGQHAGALGAAIMAGIGAGIYADVNDGWDNVKTGERNESPEKEDIEIYRGLYKTFGRKFDIQRS